MWGARLPLATPGSYGPENIFWSLWRRLFLIKLQTFNINGNGGVWFYLQAVMEFVLVKIQVFTMNGGDGVCDGGCFYLYDV